MQPSKQRSPVRRSRWCEAGIAVVIAGCTAAAGDDSAKWEAAAAEGDPAGSAGVVVAWNELGHRVAYAEDQFLTFKGQRALAMMNLAMHDALNTIAPEYERYVYDGARLDADPDLTAAQGAYEVLRSQYPGAIAQLDSLLGAQRTRTPSAAHSDAAQLGSAAAAAVLNARGGDGWDAPGAYAYRSGAGQYQTTPDWDGFVLQPGFRHTRPFALSSPQAFRPAPPPAVDSDAYATAYDEVKAYGASESIERTRDQSAYAVWWMEFAEGSVNRLARGLVLEHGLALRPAARLFALLHVALFDAYVATWDSKYEYNHWRPYTAVRSAADDGNAATVADAEWQSLLPAPPFPEYVSAHAAGCAAAFAVLAARWGDSMTFTMRTITAPEGMPERSFRSFRAAARECADSRVRLGWHFRYSTDAGLALGKRVAAHVLRTRLQPR